MQNMQTLVSGSTTFGQLYALLNNNMTTLASQFSGSTFPANPTTGQPCYRTDKNPPVWYIFNGTTWEDGAMASAVVTALLAETQKARGTAATLDARLDVALNADGTLKAPTPAGGWWTQETGAIARVSASSFSVAGDRRQIYTALRAVRLAQNTDADSHVVSCSYAAESDLTIVTIDDSVVDVGITTVFYGIDVASTPDFSSNADLTQVKAITDLVTTTPAANKVPRALATGKLDNLWLNITDMAAATASTAGAAGLVPAPPTGSQDKVLAGNGVFVDRANTDLSNLEPAANNVIKSALNATGEAPIYACRAWVNFNGTGTVAIRASGNVSSITDKGVGQYTVNFTTAMPDSDYDVVCSATTGDQGSRLANPAIYSNSSIKINCTATGRTALDDMNYVNVTIFR